MRRARQAGTSVAPIVAAATSAGGGGVTVSMTAAGIWNVTAAAANGVETVLLVAPVKESRCIPMSAEQDCLWGIDRLNVPRSDLPAITHIDYSARVQTVSREVSADYYDLIAEFERFIAPLRRMWDGGRWRWAIAGALLAIAAIAALVLA